MTKGRYTNMLQIRNIIQRLRDGQSNRKIAREIRAHRTIVKNIRSIAITHQWLDPNLPMPSDDEIAKVRGPKAKEQTHLLTIYHEDLSRWKKEDHSAVVIQELLKDKCSCDIQVIRRYLKKNFPDPIDPVMVRSTEPGRDMEIDFGLLGKFLDKAGTSKKVWVFSARLRHSRKTFRRAILNQNASTFLYSLILAFEWFYGVSRNVILDNFKAAIIKNTIDNDMVMRSFQEMAEYYGFIITPCLPRTPEHKGGIEGDIKYIKHNFLPCFLEKQKEKNIEIPTIDDLIEALEKWDREVANLHIVQGVGKCPKELFSEEERQTLQPLPKDRWEITSWCKCTVRKDWRIMHESAYYSVPFTLINQSVDVCTTTNLVRIFHENKEVAFHSRAEKKWEYRRKKEHAPPLQEEVLQCTREGLLLQAEKIGSFTYQMAKTIFSRRATDSLRPVRHLLRLGIKYSEERLEKSCERAIAYKMFSYASVKSILQNELDKQPIEVTNPSKIIAMPKYRFARDPKEYRNESFIEKLERLNPYSESGNAMGGVVMSLAIDQIEREKQREEKNHRDPTNV